MKKYIILLLIIFVMPLNISYCLSSNFKEIINVMGIERYNNQGYEINEYIYYTYNQIVYGEPEDAINEPTQRWKSVSDGKWIRNGQKGEYRLLGYNNIGKVVNNHDFPMDIVPSTQPTEWTYVVLPDALQSWNDISRYKFVSQKEYMQNVNLMRNGITYNLAASDIGFDKARLDNCSTWKTNGLIYTNRKDAYGKNWEATFVAKPIGSDVSFTNSISTKASTYYIAKYVSSTNITFNYQAGITTASKYIKPEHVKKIETSIYINGYLLKTITTTNKLSHKGSVTVTVYHQDLKATSTQNIDVRSKLYTQFTTDGPLYAKNSNTVDVVIARHIPSYVVDREELNESDYMDPVIKTPQDKSNVDLGYNIDADVELGKIVKRNGKQYIKNLSKSNTSPGFISAGHMMGIKLKTSPNVFMVKMSIVGDKSISTFDDKTKKFEWDDPIAQGNDTLYNSLQDYVEIYDKNEYILEKSTDGTYVMEYLIPYETKQTLHSWNTIRQMQGSSFNIDKSLLLSRINNPYTLKFEIYEQVEEETENGVNIYTVKSDKYYDLDIFECWSNLYNRDLTPYILNNNEEEVEYDIWKQT